MMRQQQQQHYQIIDDWWKSVNTYVSEGVREGGREFSRYLYSLCVCFVCGLDCIPVLKNRLIAVRACADWSEISRVFFVAVGCFERPCEFFSPKEIERREGFFYRACTR